MRRVEESYLKHPRSSSSFEDLKIKPLKIWISSLQRFKDQAFEGLKIKLWRFEDQAFDDSKTKPSKIWRSKIPRFKSSIWDQTFTPLVNVSNTEVQAQVKDKPKSKPKSKGSSQNFRQARVQVQDKLKLKPELKMQ